MPICLTFDTERNDYETLTDREKLAYEKKEFSMLEKAIPRLLDIADEYGINYTFFLCGEVAQEKSDLFYGLKRHCIGVHTHPFTHSEIFKGKTPNDREKDLMNIYSLRDQCSMIQADRNLISDNLGITPTCFRAGKHSANMDTFVALDELGFKIDCSMHPSLQLIGWLPFKIHNTSIWEIPSYCDMSPEMASSIKLVYNLSSMTNILFKGIYVGIIHPMIFGNDNLNNKLLFDKYKDLIEFLLRKDFEFLTIEDAFIKSRRENLHHNYIGRSLTALIHPIQLALRNKCLDPSFK